jgi:two-component system, NtrC family, sensor kinase
MLWNFVLYLLYGLAFFTLGVAILSRDIRLSELGIARILWLLACFGIVHGFHEWLALLELLFPQVNNAGFAFFRLIVVSFSFLFLFYFGLFINIITINGDRALETTPRIIKGFVGVVALSLILLAAYFDLGSTKAINTRLLIAFPGSMLSGVGLILYSRTARTFSGSVATNFILAGSCMICYAVLTGLIPSDATLPILGTKVIFLRSLSAFLIMVFTIRALSVFNLEQRELINERLLRFSQSEKLTSMGILAAGIAHEINTPLTNISLNVEMLKDLVGRDEKVTKKIDAIERNIDRASRIAKELLHFSREKETGLQPIDLNEIVKSAKNLLSSQPRWSIIHLSLLGIPNIMGIPWKLEEVFINLLMNSLDACNEKNDIEVKTFCRSKLVVATISDTGHGITEEHLGKVFDPFFTTKEIGKGTGLGLSVCYNIIRQHGGTIAINKREQGGTIVTLTFPVITDDN